MMTTESSNQVQQSGLKIYSKDPLAGHVQTIAKASLKDFQIWESVSKV